MVASLLFKNYISIYCYIFFFSNHFLFQVYFLFQIFILSLTSFLNCIKISFAYISVDYEVLSLKLIRIIFILYTLTLLCDNIKKIFTFWILSLLSFLKEKNCHKFLVLFLAKNVWRFEASRTEIQRYVKL